MLALDAALVAAEDCAPNIIGASVLALQCALNEAIQPIVDSLPDSPNLSSFEQLVLLEQDAVKKLAQNPQTFGGCPK